MYFNNDINKYKEIFDKCNTIEEKLNAIGLNKNIFDKFNQVFTSKMESHNKDMFFASPYIIELSNCILNVISLINEPIESTKTTLIEEMKLFNPKTMFIIMSKIVLRAKFIIFGAFLILFFYRFNIYFI